MTTTGHSDVQVPRPGMFATVRNRRGVIAAVEPHDGDAGRLHLVHIDYKDDQLPAEEHLVREAAAVPAGSDGVLLLPYFAGERTPIFDARARGLIVGLSLRHTRAHLFRAVYEGIAFGIRQILELLDGDIDSVNRVVAVGGGTQGGLWTQIVSDITGREQEVPAESIGASYGDALVAAIGVGLVPPETDWAAPGQTVKPDPATQEVYSALYRSYCDLYPATKAYMHQIACLQEQHADASGQTPPDVD